MIQQHFHYLKNTSYRNCQKYTQLDQKNNGSHIHTKQKHYNNLDVTNNIQIIEAELFAIQASNYINGNELHAVVHYSILHNTYIRISIYTHICTFASPFYSLSNI